MFPLFLFTTDAFDSKHTQDPEDSHEARGKKSEEKERRLAVSRWHIDVQPLVSSSKWLQLHGLKRNKLSLSQILSQIGFQHRKGIRQINNRIRKLWIVFRVTLILHPSVHRDFHAVSYLMIMAEGEAGSTVADIGSSENRERHLLLIWELRIWEGLSLLNCTVVLP